MAEKHIFYLRLEIGEVWNGSTFTGDVCSDRRIAPLLLVGTELRTELLYLSGYFMKSKAKLQKNRLKIISFPH